MKFYYITICTISGELGVQEREVLKETKRQYHFEEYPRRFNKDYLDVFDRNYSEITLLTEYKNEGIARIKKELERTLIGDIITLKAQIKAKKRVIDANQA